MNVKRLIESLSKLPEESEVELCKLIAVHRESGEPFQVTLDAPIVGLAEMNDCVLLLIEADAHILGIGNIIRMSEESPPKTYYGCATEVEGSIRLIDAPLQETPELPTKTARNISMEKNWPMHVVKVEVIGTYRGQGVPFRPDWAVAPGEAIQELLETENMTLDQAAELTGIDLSRLSELLVARIELTEDDAEKLAKLRYNKQFWLNYEKNYREALARQKVPS